MDVEDELVLEGHEQTHDRVDLARQTTISGRTFEVRATSDGNRVRLSLALYAAADVRLGQIQGELPADDVDQLRQAVNSLLGWVDRTLKQTATPDEKLAKLREVHPNAYQPWTAEEEAELSDRFRQGASVQALAEHFGRQPGGVSSRLVKIGAVPPHIPSRQLLPDATMADVQRWQNGQPSA